jgi:hypothetical protein
MMVTVFLSLIRHSFQLFHKTSTLVLLNPFKVITNDLTLNYVFQRDQSCLFMDSLEHT